MIKNYVVAVPVIITETKIGVEFMTKWGLLNVWRKI